MTLKIRLEQDKLLQNSSNGFQSPSYSFADVILSALASPSHELCFLVYLNHSSHVSASGPSHLPPAFYSLSYTHHHAFVSHFFSLWSNILLAPGLHHTIEMWSFSLTCITLIYNWNKGFPSCLFLIYTLINFQIYSLS